MKLRVPWNWDVTWPPKGWFSGLLGQIWIQSRWWFNIFFHRAAMEMNYLCNGVFSHSYVKFPGDRFAHKKESKFFKRCLRLAGTQVWIGGHHAIRWMRAKSESPVENRGKHPMINHVSTLQLVMRNFFHAQYQTELLGIFVWISSRYLWTLSRGIVH